MRSKIGILGLKEKQHPTLVSFDPKYGCWYFEFSKNKVAKTIEHTEDAYIDLDKEGELVGLELIGVTVVGQIKKNLPKSVPVITRSKHTSSRV